MENENDILIEYDYVKAICFSEGISGSNIVLVGGTNIFIKTALKKSNSKIRSVARERHEVC